MAEEEINYASVVFKARTQPKFEAKREEETVYDEVKVQNETSEQAADTNASAGFLPDKTADSRRRHYLQLACCLTTVCVMLLLGIIAVCVYLATLIHDGDQSLLNELKDNQSMLLAINRNLTNLSSNYENLRRDHSNLTVQFNNLTQAHTVLESKITTLTAENQNLTRQNEEMNRRNGELETTSRELQTQNQQLEKQKKNLTEQLQNMETERRELNVTLAQWSIDQYCPKKNNNRRCAACQPGWETYQSSCYVSLDYGNSVYWKTWEEARQNCRGKSSDLVVVKNNPEKDFVNSKSFGSSGDNGYWIGLRAENGTWKWIDGSNVTESSWIQQPATSGHCVISVQNQGWKSVSCGNKNRWMCKKKALSI